MKKKIGFGLMALLIVSQFFRIDKSPVQHPAGNDLLTLERAPSEVSEILRNACYDCHSFETDYPWYTNITPVAQWIKGHIDNGRDNLNYSTWGEYDEDKRQHKIEETIEEIERGHMPPKSYGWLHAEARISDRDKKQVLEWLGTLRRK